MQQGEDKRLGLVFQIVATEMRGEKREVHQLVVDLTPREFKVMGNVIWNTTDDYDTTARACQDIYKKIRTLHEIADKAVDDENKAKEAVS